MSTFIILLLLNYSGCIISTQQDGFGDTALIIASQRGYVKCATILLKHGGNVNYQRKVRLFMLNDKEYTHICGVAQNIGKLLCQLQQHTSEFPRLYSWTSALLMHQTITTFGRRDLPPPQSIHVQSHCENIVLLWLRSHKLIL